MSLNVHTQKKSHPLKNNKPFFFSLLIAIIGGAIIVTACQSRGYSETTDKKGEATKKENQYANPTLPPRPPAPKGIEGGLQRATFAGGCFWCMETPFESLPGVKSVISGYTGGRYEAPSYEAVASHATDQVEAIDIIYDPKLVSYKDLLKIYWKQIDPTDKGGQFVDRGPQYRPYIWVHNAEQRRDAEESKKILQESGNYSKPIAVEIADAVTFWPAEEYHQDFYKKQPTRYKFYRKHSGRDQYLQSHTCPYK